MSAPRVPAPHPLSLCKALVAVGGLVLAAAGLDGALAGASRAQAPVVQTGHVTAELVPERSAATPGQTLYVALHQTIAPGWHTYWRNPGDAGQPTSLAWTLPPGWSAGEIVWPAPERFLAGPIMNYVYTGQVELPVPVSVPRTARPGAPVMLKVSANWLVCKDVCIPEHADLALDIPVQAAPAPQTAAGKAVAATLARAPRPDGLSSRFALAGATARLSVSGAALHGLDPSGAYFFPYDGTLLDQASAQHAARMAGGLVLTLPAGYGLSHGKSPSRLDGVLSVSGRAFAISASPMAVAAASTPAAAPAPAVDDRAGTPAGVGAGVAASASPPSSPSLAPVAPPLPAAPPPTRMGWGAALALAFLGGVLLNLMPCVFPVLSMKAAALARHLEAPARARGEGLAFLAGVVASFVLLALALMLARSAGQAVGWGFQLQSPVVVAVLTLVLLLSGLNLSGVFEAGLSLQNLGSGAAARTGGLLGSALTGVLAVVVAAPCSAPFMAPAMGWALLQPAGVALSVFVALGLGLAAPFVLVSFTPRLFARLPRPGPWMEGLRRLLAFPMYGAAAWFAWVFALQAGAVGLPRLFAAALAVAFAAHCWGVAQRSSRTVLARGAAVAAFLGAALALVGVEAAPLAAAEAVPTAGGPQPWSQGRVAELQAQGRPVFVDFTAAWCVTCQVNERTALATPEVASAFARDRAVYLKADWTRPDPAIAAALAGQGRSGVPLYLVYTPGHLAPTVLPQLLTGRAVAAALDAAAATRS